MIHVACLFALAPVPIQVDQAARAGSLAETLDPALDELVQRYRLPGLAVGVVRSGEVVYTGSFGEKVRDSGEPVTEESIFHMASVSKPFVATAVMQLVEAGKMDLDAPLVEYLPYFGLKDEESRTITVRQVLTHTSGMPDVGDYQWDRPQTDAGAAERYVRSLTGEELLFPPGQGSSYSNMAFDVMGDVIAKVSGVPFEDYVKANILEPLGMVSSSFVHAETPEEHWTRGHSLFFTEKVDQPPCPVYPYNRRHAPSSTLNSNVVDMCRWALANLGRGRLGEARILSEAGYGELWNRDDDTPGIGLSWFLAELAGRPTVDHGGSDVGFNSNLSLFPEDDLGVVVMINADGTPVGAISEAVARAALGLEWRLPDPGVYRPVAHTLEREGLEAAIDLYLRLREEEPDRWSFDFGQLDNLRGFLMEAGRAEEAVEIAALNLERYSEWVPAYTALGEAQLRAGDTEGALATFEHALLLDPDDVPAAEGLAKAKAGG